MSWVYSDDPFTFFYFYLPNIAFIPLFEDVLLAFNISSYLSVDAAYSYSPI